METLFFARGSKRLSRQRKRGLQIFSGGMVFIFLIATMIGIVKKRNNFVNVGYQVTDLRKETVSLKEEQARLRAEVAGLKNPERVLRKVVDMGLTPIPNRNRFKVHLIRPSEVPVPLIANLKQKH